MKHFVLTLLMVTGPLAMGQSVRIPDAIEKLGQKAAETVDVTMGPDMLQFVRGMTGDDPEATRILSGLKGLRVRSFEFEKEGEYAPSDIEAMRQQLTAPTWSRIAVVRSKRDRENVDIYMKAGTNSIGGMVVLVAGPKELTIVDIDGTIRPEDLNHIRGRAGIPVLDLPTTEKAKQ